VHIKREEYLLEYVITHVQSHLEEAIFDTEEENEPERFGDEENGNYGNQSDEVKSEISYTDREEIGACENDKLNGTEDEKMAEHF